MKESEIQEAVKIARGYLGRNNGLGHFDLKLICSALVALNADDICDDDEAEDDEPSVGIASGIALQEMRRVAAVDELDYESPFVVRNGICVKDRYGDRVGKRVMQFQDPVCALGFHVGMRLCWPSSNRTPGLGERAWRWLAKGNLRVTDVDLDHGIITFASAR